jgi:hypothetical protein
MLISELNSEKSFIVIFAASHPVLWFYYSKLSIIQFKNITQYTGYFASDNEPGGIENATHNTFPKLT